MSQKHHEILMELKPLETLFNALTDEKALLYCKQLQKFDIATIRIAVDKVSGEWDRLSFPPPGVIVAACNLRSTGTRSMEGNRVQFPWEERDENRRKAISEYTTKYRNFPMFKQAQAEGWESELRTYVWEAASVQAQYIFPYPDGRIELMWYVLQPEGLEKDKKWAFNRDFLRDARGQAERGYIDVAIPTSKMAEWQARAERVRNRQQVTPHGMSRKYGVPLSEVLDPIASRIPPQEVLPPIESYGDINAAEYVEL